MKSRILLHCRCIKRIAVLERKYRLVLRPVILIHAANVLKQRSSPNKYQEQRQPDQAIDQIEHDLAIQRRMRLLQLGGGQQRQVLVHENEESDGDQNIDGCNPAADFKLLLGRLAGFVLLQLIQLHIGRESQSAEAECHGMPERHNTAHDRPSHPPVFLGKPFQRFAVRHEFARRLAAGDAPGMRSAHHNAFEHGLAADQRLLAAFERWQKLHAHQKAPQCLKKPHKDWMILGREMLQD